MEQPDQFLQLRQVWSGSVSSSGLVSTSGLEQELIEPAIKIITKELLYSEEEEEEEDEEEEKEINPESKPESISFVKREQIFDPTSEITLECLMNKTTYLKYIKNQKLEHNIKSNVKNRKFYKKRIYDLTKQLMHSEPSPSTEISKTFENYINSCINHFQILDKTDILQEDYANITESELCKLAKLESIEEANKSMMRFVKMYEPNSLEKIIKRTVTKMGAPDPVLPKQKNINLKDPILRNKGICKKNNISNQYEVDTETKL